ncbi:hypothetical protein MJO29_013658 [Puccinia striiformis f. sp. tritici]|nr:hypothetical protein MJO29_013658 [Puccinia striiformis f. sp. tritici]
MAPRSFSKVVCACNRCIQFKYYDETGAHSGQLVGAGTRKAHVSADARVALLARAANEEEQPFDPSELTIDLPEDDLEDLEDKTLPIAVDEPHELDTDVPAQLAPITEPDQLLESLAGLAVVDDVIEYNCSRFHKATTYDKTHPAVLLISLKIALFYVTELSSLYTSTCLLQLDCMLMELMIAQSLSSPSSPKEIPFEHKVVLKSLPKCTQTVLHRLAIDPDLTFFICCPSCFATYPDGSTGPELCTNRVEDDSKKTSDLNRTGEGNTSETPSFCDAPLFKDFGCAKPSPFRRLAIQDLFSWLGRLFSRKGIEAALDQTAIKSQSPYDALLDQLDIQDSRIWKQFVGANGEQFTANGGNITFGMFMDGINPHGNRIAGKHVSVTFMIMICYSLPVSLRYRSENIFLVGIAPGPKEPSLEQVNWILQPVVEQLKSLWNPGVHLSRTHQFPEGRTISAALLPFFADLPALRRSLGFAGPTARKMCSYCLLPKNEIENINIESWPLRDLDEHRHWAKKSRNSTTLKEKKKILDDQGVRYSVLLELPYWNILEYHVVDSMHNLLLGLLKWHCQRLWQMDEKVDDFGKDPEEEPEDQQVELAHQTIPTDDQAFRELLLDIQVDSSEDERVPDISGEQWGGKWIPPDDKTIFDGPMLKKINSFLKRVCIPTWIKRAIPVLGKASFGRLKADEWRNLFTIQLPLILPHLWNNGERSSQSLLHNFAHLVSLVTVALKRAMNSNHIKNYCHHLHSYIESCLTLFPDVTLAPNHHMAFHLADCLERFGPSRAWWSFSMERLMAQVLKNTGNNRIGQLEITYLTNFGRVSNLKALLQSGNFPPSLEPFIRQIRALYEPIPFIRQAQVQTCQTPLENEWFLHLVTRLNELFPVEDHKWAASDDWHRSKSQNTLAPVNSRVRVVSNFKKGEEIYTSMKTNKNNCVVALKPDAKLKYGMIDRIFLHSRTPPGLPLQTDTWLALKPLHPVPATNNPFAQLDKYAFDVTLRTLQDDPIYIVHSDELLAHCAWLKYRPRELHPKITSETYALVCLNR